jgi:DNA repair protein RadA/Sms
MVAPTSAFGSVEGFLTTRRCSTLLEKRPYNQDNSGKNMAKSQGEYVCGNCGARFPKWVGRCTQCGDWDGLQSVAHPSEKNWVDSEVRPQALTEIVINSTQERWQTEVQEFDRVVGGGIVRGSIGLLGGTPGVGKSTLILQLLARLVKMNLKVLYVSGEESVRQIKQRADRLVIQQHGIVVLTESALEPVLAVITEHRPDFVVIDSIQTLYSQALTASAGSVSQVRETGSVLLKVAKKEHLSVLLVGHVTKEGDIAGPRTLEHMVDYVLYLEGEKREQQRLLRAVKNRFGTVSEIGLFKMSDKGLIEVRTPNQLFMSRYQSVRPGTAFFAAHEGSRTLFLEVQVLVGDTQQHHPARTAMGMDRNRLQLIVAILEKHLGMDFSRNDIYVNLAGGFKVVEPAIDLALVAALLSSHLAFALPPYSVFFGEAALTGEFRAIPAMTERIYESERCGFKQAFVPSQGIETLRAAELSLSLVAVDHIQSIIELLQAG